jgi:putative oxidoreductase
MRMLKLSGLVSAATLLGILRIVAGLLFMAHGTQKLRAFPGAPGASSVPIASLLGVAGLLEAIGGAMLVFGIFTRPVAFVVAGEMAVAYFRSHAPQGPWPILNRGELAVLFCFLWLYIAAAGPGRFSLDGRRRGSRRA